MILQYFFKILNAGLRIVIVVLVPTEQHVSQKSPKRSVRFLLTQQKTRNWELWNNLILTSERNMVSPPCVRIAWWQRGHMSTDVICRISRMIFKLLKLVSGSFIVTHVLLQLVWDLLLWRPAQSQSLPVCSVIFFFIAFHSQVMQQIPFLNCNLLSTMNRNVYPVICIQGIQLNMKNTSPMNNITNVFHVGENIASSISCPPVVFTVVGLPFIPLESFPV